MSPTIESVLPNVTSSPEAKPKISWDGNKAPAIVVVEGIHDVEFLQRLTARLHQEAPSIPDLQELEHNQALVFIPFGGGHVLRWAERFAPLGCPEFHLFDRECEPETALRYQAADLVNSRPGCRALVTSKRSLENYLHMVAIHAAGGGLIEVQDQDDVALCYARRSFLARPHDCAWDALPTKAQRRMAATAKKWLNTAAVDCMTLELLRHRDPQGELITWIRAIGHAAITR